jgi:GINS complex subunit 4
MVNTLRSDPQTSEEEHFKLMLVQTEMERVKYLVRSYVRTRLHKVCPLLFFATSKAGRRG